MALPADIDFAANPSASPSRMNLAMAHLDARLRAMETPRGALDQELAQLLRIGLTRINDALQPYYQALTAIVSLGILTNATSATVVPIGLGRVRFTLSDEDKDRFAFSGFLQAVSAADTRNALLGRFAAYDRTTGVLALDVVIASGEGAPSDWMIMPSVPPFVPSAVIDAGSDDTPALAAVPYIQATPEPALAVLLNQLPTSPDGLLPGSLWLNGGVPCLVQP